jgi:hypothetical protein
MAAIERVHRNQSATNHRRSENRHAFNLPQFFRVAYATEKSSLGRWTKYRLKTSPPNWSDNGTKSQVRVRALSEKRKHREAMAQQVSDGATSDSKKRADKWKR